MSSAFYAPAEVALPRLSSIRLNEPMTPCMRIFGALSLVAASVGAAAAQEKPRITPVFSSVAVGPTFLVECVNDTGRTMASNADHWAWAPNHLRIDGKPYVEAGGVIGPGLSTDIAPMAWWRGLVTLHQERPMFSPAVVFGAHVRGGPSVRLAPGRHSVAFRCGDTWSDDYVFYWEGR
jgi:hypothetical protein